jgi:hypothetical protein
MKKMIFTLALTIGFLSCEKDKTVNTNSNTSAEMVNEMLNSSNGFKINEFIEDGVNKTNDYSSWLFTFNANGSVSASESGQNISGTYLVFSDDGQTELSMTFPNGNELFELTDDWYFISENGNTIRFDDNGDVIQFERQ